MSGLFDAYVSSILYYSREVWGVNKGTEVEKLHLELSIETGRYRKNGNNLYVRLFKYN